MTGTLRSALARLRERPGDVGEEPDPRFSFANERTFLAWTRTALALIAGGLAAAQALHFSGHAGLHLLVAIPAIALGGVIGVVSYFRWENNERAMRLSQPLGYSPLTRIIAAGIVGLAVVSALLVVVAEIAK